MLVLGIESTCDETAASIVKDGKEILSNVIASQVALHKPFGGVYPELASRSHVNTITSVIDLALKEARVSKNEIDLIAVAKGPGLIGSLLVGLNAAKALSLAWQKPFIGVNHVEAHLYAAMMTQEKIQLPALGVVISGGHTFIVLIEEQGSYRLLGSTVDDAIGEAFDKVAVMLSLPYPGGPEVEKLAKKGNPQQYKFKAGKVKERPFDFSFSGLKTNVYYMIHGQNAKESVSLLTEAEKADIAASFQYCAFKDLIAKCEKAACEYGCRAIYFGGGVSNNQTLKEMLVESRINVPIFWPPKGLSLDNAAMIAGLGYVLYQKGQGADALTLEPETRIPLMTSALRTYH